VIGSLTETYPIEPLDVDVGQLQWSKAIAMLMRSSAICERSKTCVKRKHLDGVPSRLMTSKTIHGIEPAVEFTNDPFCHVAGSGQSWMEKMLRQPVKVVFQELNRIFEMDLAKFRIQLDDAQMHSGFLKVAGI